MRHRVPASLRKLMEELENLTRDCGGLNLTIAIDYGARDELARALQAMAGRAADGGDINEIAIGGALDTRDLPEPDFVIRTSGEQRVSNFLLWQSVYAEYSFPEVAWPDFTAGHLADQVAEYTQRQRRYGGLATASAEFAQPVRSSG
jgi:undecaprenyl diphosphate synthase